MPNIFKKSKKYFSLEKPSPSVEILDQKTSKQRRKKIKKTSGTINLKEIKKPGTRKNSRRINTNSRIIN